MFQIFGNVAHWIYRRCLLTYFHSLRDKLKSSRYNLFHPGMSHSDAKQKTIFHKRKTFNLVEINVSVVLYHDGAGNVKMKQFIKGYPSVRSLGQIAVNNY